MDDALFASPQPTAAEAVPALSLPSRDVSSAPPATPPIVSAVERQHAVVSRRQTGALWILLLAFTLLLVGPFLVGRFVYEKTYNELKAGYDVATGTLGDIKPRLNDLEMASRLVAKRVEPSVVSITRPTGGLLEGQGSGVIVDKAGYIITNFHVVNGTDKVQVRLSDRRVTEGEVVGADAMTDIAVLKIDLDNLIPAEWGDSDKLEVGDLVWALGSPYGLDRSLTFGIVSAKARHTNSYSPHSSSPYQEYLQTDAAVNPGNSGGPLVNIEGQIIGINAAIFGSAYQGISFSIPSAIARDRYEELKAKGHVDRAWLGIEPLEVPDSMRTKLGLGLSEGVLVGTVDPHAPAGRVGVHSNDIILKWNDHVATDPTLLSRAIAATEIGSTAKLVLVRVSNNGKDKQQLALDVKVERRPKGDDER
ncbi:MAG TPA: trypsin-like peptidase domain-containing protein [Lacipirellulaceae bacterium]|nr:trypsin-like peptidase domain-containing protein [Lacipirellulaceae bacterium]